MTTQDNITTLKDNQVFVFGSNLNGNHAGGAAKLASEKFGAEDGVGEGLTGQSYAFPTLDKKMAKVSIEALKKSKEALYKTAETNPEKQFLVTKLGCGIAGFSEEEMKEVFNGEKPKNVVLPAGWSVVRGYKAFDKGLKCRGFQYELSKDFYHKGEIVLCESGFHFCKSLGEVYEYYNYRSDIEVCEVESEGEVIDEVGGKKSVTNHLRIIRVLNKVEASNNSGVNNLGHNNTGHRNTGDRNTGGWNTGDRNTGDTNTGYSNTGDNNTGHSNTGDSNTGHRNTGDNNTGHKNTGYKNTGGSNTGHRNTGDSNTGDWNTGDRNTGYRNTGDSNTGYRNTGGWNTGGWNTGDSNTGHSNTGDWNTGYRNTGHWNTSDYNNGCFNTKEVVEILVFNKLCNKKEWDSSTKPSCLFFQVNKWVPFKDMTDEEKELHKTTEQTGGYMKKLDYKDAFTESMEKASVEEIKQLKALPNFDVDVFEEISGFRVN